MIPKIQDDLGWTLSKGDLVCTVDGGPQPIRWIGARRVPAVGHLAPIRIASGTLGNARDLLVSPQHRILLQGWPMQMLFDSSEVLAPAKGLINDATIRRETGGWVEYFHMLFDAHQVVWSEGIRTESFHPGQVGMGSFTEGVREEILSLFPELRHDVAAYGATARPCLKPCESAVAMQQLGPTDRAA